MIKLQIVGKLGKDCIVKEINGQSVINFSVVHSERFKDRQGNQKERATWVECAYWTDKTGVVPYLTKGTTIYAEGYPEADAYTNKENQPAATLRMRVQSVQLISAGNTNSEGGSQNQNSGNSNYNSGNNNNSNSGGNNYNGGSSNQSPSNNTAMATASTASDASDDLPF